MGLATAATPALCALGWHATAGVLPFAILAHLVHLKVDGPAGLAAAAAPALCALGLRAEAGVLPFAILAHRRHDGEPTVLKRGQWGGRAVPSGGLWLCHPLQI